LTILNDYVIYNDDSSSHIQHSNTQTRKHLKGNIMDFSKLKNMSGTKSMESLNAELSKMATQDSGKRGADERFWTPTVDKAGNGYAVIRFLPPPSDEDVPFVRLYDHGFQGPTGLWYIENSLTSIGNPDPVSEYNSKLWNSGVESDKEIARKQKRRLHFISNIYVVSDSAKPENEGKVFLYKYGKKIFEKLNEAMNPQFADEESVNPFDLWQGGNFKLKIRKVDGYRNYDKSEFDSASALNDDDSALERIWKSENSLQEFVSASNFKSYEQLKDRLMRVLNILPKEEPAYRPEADIPETKQPEFSNTDYQVTNNNNNDDDESLEFFQKLANS
jgi:hypothetical protein|tara:strand:+ start:9108 stop:10103 length:996 start_codon:yes stop_codon:yes gene_type:complete